MISDRVVFLDIGGWNGCSIDAALRRWPGCKIYTFEPLEENIKKIDRYVAKGMTQLVPQAAWSSTCIKKFYKGLSQSGTLYKEKRSGEVNPENWENVCCVDIAEWICKNLYFSDYIIMKLNCEGAEYDIIQRLANVKMLWRINEWYIQWHWHKIKLSKKKHDIISSMVNSNPWEVMK